MVTTDSISTKKNKNVIMEIYKLLHFSFILGYLEVHDISIDLIERCFYTSLCNETEDGMSDNRKHSYPDLLVRTSGESRLSDFLLWQSSYSITHFTDVLWPNFGLHHLMASIFYYQSQTYFMSEIMKLSRSKMDETLSNLEINLEKAAGSKRISRFLELLDNSKGSFIRSSDFMPDDSTFRNVMSNL